VIYKEQLLTAEWKSKRDILLKRDKNICQHCKNSNIVQNGIPAIILTANSNRSFFVFNLLTRSTIIVELFSLSYKYSNHTNSLCFLSRDYNAIIAVLSKSFPVNRNVNFTVSSIFDEDEKSEKELNSLFYKFYEAETF